MNPNTSEPPHFTYRGGVLHCEGVPLPDLADEAGPSFVYSAASVDEAYRAVEAAMAPTPNLIAYAIKANGNLSLLRRLAAAGCGADIVSGGELERALKAGIPPERIVYSGVGKTDAELRRAIEVGIRAIHVESVPELDAVERLAPANQKVRIAFRVNPDVDPQTHPYIATGLHDTKFGLELDVARALLPRVVASETLELEGVACHIGSQLSTPEPLAEAVAILARFACECHEAGAPIRSIDVGGGWPMAYGDEKAPYPPHSVFGDAIRAGLAEGGATDLDLEVITEPGRALVGDAGVLLTRVIFVKEQAGKRFIIVDAAMTELIRPALYRAYHAVLPVTEPSADAEWTPADVVGPVCESGDFIAEGRLMPDVEAGDLLAIRGAGAYGREMASTYNARPLAEELLVEGDSHRVVRRRAPLESLWAGEED